MTAGGSSARGLRRGVTHYGDSGFAQILRRSFESSRWACPTTPSTVVVRIADTASGFDNRHRTVPALIEAAGRGVPMAGGLPIPFPTISFGEPWLAPTGMSGGPRRAPAPGRARRRARRGPGGGGPGPRPDPTRATFRSAPRTLPTVGGSATL